MFMCVGLLHFRRVYFGGSGGASGSHHRRGYPNRQGARGGQSGGIVYIKTSGQLHVSGGGLNRRPLLDSI